MNHNKDREIINNFDKCIVEIDNKFIKKNHLNKNNKINLSKLTNSPHNYTPRGIQKLDSPRRKTEVNQNDHSLIKNKSVVINDEEKYAIK